LLLPFVLHFPHLSSSFFLPYFTISFNLSSLFLLSFIVSSFCLSVLPVYPFCLSSFFLLLLIFVSVYSLFLNFWQPDLHVDHNILINVSVATEYNHYKCSGENNAKVKLQLEMFTKKWQSLLTLKVKPKNQPTKQPCLCTTLRVLQFKINNGIKINFTCSFHEVNKVNGDVSCRSLRIDICLQP
jgi:hypothetical protein